LSGTPIPRRNSSGTEPCRRISNPTIDAAACLTSSIPSSSERSTSMKTVWPMIAEVTSTRERVVRLNRVPVKSDSHSLAPARTASVKSACESNVLRRSARERLAPDRRAFCMSLPERSQSSSWACQRSLLLRLLHLGRIRENRRLVSLPAQNCSAEDLDDEDLHRVDQE